MIKTCGRFKAEVYRDGGGGYIEFYPNDVVPPDRIRVPLEEMQDLKYLVDRMIHAARDYLVEGHKHLVD